MNHLDLVTLTSLMKLTSGRTDITVGLIDGPIAMSHPDLASESIREIPGSISGTCTQNSIACMHGTFVTGILCAKRGSAAPAICPRCTLLVRPIFEGAFENRQLPSTTPEELAAAIIDTVRAGAHVLNLSVTQLQPSSKGQRELDEALEYAARHSVLIVAAAGNEGAIGSSDITRHPWVIPIVGYDLRGRPLGSSNLGSSIGKRGLGAPGEDITSLGVDGTPLTLTGTSSAAPFVTGTIALLRSLFPTATTLQVKQAIIQSAAPRRTTIVPPLLDSWAAYQTLASMYERGWMF